MIERTDVSHDAKGRKPLREAPQIHRYALFLSGRFTTVLGN